MTQEEIQQRNVQIALMLGYSNPIVDKNFYFVTKDDYVESSAIPKLLELNFEKRFYSDWNWLMESVDFIEKLNVEYSIEIVRNTCVIRHFSKIFSAQYFQKKQKQKRSCFYSSIRFR
jgi:hypothetical protein